MRQSPSWITRVLGSSEDKSRLDTNVDMLKRMSDDGDDLTENHDFDFNHIFTYEENALAFLEAMKNAGYPRGDCDYWSEQLAWQTAVYVKMVPELEKISAIEAELNEIAAAFDGRPDGWGCMELIKSDTQ